MEKNVKENVAHLFQRFVRKQKLRFIPAFNVSTIIVTKCMLYVVIVSLKRYLIKDSDGHERKLDKKRTIQIK